MFPHAVSMSLCFVPKGGIAASTHSYEVAGRVLLGLESEKSQF
jgi:hypothetical protein